MTNVYLIRHAQHIENIISTLDHPPDPPLSSLGITQAEHLRDRLAATGEIQAYVLLSSPLSRARETAEIIAPALSLSLTLDDDLQEFRIGNREGIADEDIAHKFSLIDFEKEPTRPVFPGGESWNEFTQRVCGAFERITRNYDGKTIVILSHDGVIAVSFLYFLGLPALKFVKGIFRPAFGQLYTNTTSITNWYKSLFRDFQKQEPMWTLVRYNDDVHLYDMGSKERINWKEITPEFGGGPGKRPVRVRME